MTLNALTVSMKGDGYYDEHSQTQNVVIRHVIPLVAELAASIPASPAASNFCIVDYGCSEGKNSVMIVESAIRAVRSVRPKQNFLVVHEDLPANNFNRLFSQLYDSGNKAAVSAYESSDESKVFVFASGSSFYDRVMPANFVQLAISSSAAHWTSARPRISKHIFHADASIDENQIYKEAAAKDWHKFLECRALELASGGKLFVTLAARISEADDAEGLFHEKHSARIIFQLLNSVLEELVAEEIIDATALRDFSIPIYCRSKSEMLEPIDTGKLAEQLELEYIKIDSIPCPLHAQFKTDGDEGKYADGLAGIVRAITEPILLHGLFKLKERRKSSLLISEQQKILNSLYGRLRAKILAAPDRYTFYPCHATLVFKKRS